MLLSLDDFEEGMLIRSNENSHIYYNHIQDPDTGYNHYDCNYIELKNGKEFLTPQLINEATEYDEAYTYRLVNNDKEKLDVYSKLYDLPRDKIEL